MAEEQKTPTMPTLPAGAAARYQPLAVLGRGSYGVVIRALDRRLGREVALKVLHSILMHPDVRARFAREAQVTAAMRHPGIIGLLDHGVEENGAAWIAYELLEGGSLEDHLREHGPMAPRELARIGVAGARALAALHANGALHRDLKPANVLLRRDEPVLCDLGLVHLAMTTQRLTQTGALTGTPAYLAPEVWEGEKAGPRSDCWSWAAVLHMMGSGRKVCDASAMGGFLEWISAGAPASAPDELREEAPALAAVLDRALAADPAERFPDAETFAAALDLALPPTGVQPQVDAASLGRPEGPGSTPPGPPAGDEAGAAPLLGTGGGAAVGPQAAAPARFGPRMLALGLAGVLAGAGVGWLRSRGGGAAGVQVVDTRPEALGGPSATGATTPSGVAAHDELFEAARALAALLPAPAGGYPAPTTLDRGEVPRWGEVLTRPELLERFGEWLDAVARHPLPGDEGADPGKALPVAALAPGLFAAELFTMTGSWRDMKVLDIFSGQGPTRDEQRLRDAWPATQQQVFALVREYLDHVPLAPDLDVGRLLVGGVLVGGLANHRAQAASDALRARLETEPGAGRRAWLLLAGYTLAHHGVTARNLPCEDRRRLVVALGRATRGLPPEVPATWRAATLARGAREQMVDVRLCPGHAPVEDVHDQVLDLVTRLEALRPQAPEATAAAAAHGLRGRRTVLVALAQFPPRLHALRQRLEALSKTAPRRPLSLPWRP